MMDGYYTFRCGERVGLADEDQRVVVKPLWEEIREPREGYAVVKLHGKFGAVDCQGRMAAAPEWDELRDCSEGLFIAKKDGEFFILRINGREPVHIAYDKCREVYSFFERNAVFMDDYSCKYGCIDQFGRLMVGPMYDTPSEARAAAREEE